MAALSRNEENRDAANLSALIESTDDAIWSVDLNYRLLSFNRAWQKGIEEHFGVRPALGMAPTDLFPPAQAEASVGRYQRALSSGPFRFEYSLADGRTLELSLQPLIQDGQKTGVSVFGRDITARKAAETALKEAEQNYRDIFDGALEGIFRTAPDGRVLASNPAFARILGYDSAQEFLSACTDVTRQVWLDPNERARLSGLLEEQGTVRDYECQFKRKDGSVTWVSVNARKVCGPDGQGAFYEGFIEDIAEHKAMADALRKSQEQFAKAFLSSPAATVLADLDDGDRLVDVNEAFEETSGYRRDEAIGRTTEELGLWADPREHVEFEAELRATGRKRDFEAHFRRKTGELATGLISAELIEIHGKPFSIAATIDITDRKLTEEALRRSEETFSKVFRSNPAAMSLSDVDGQLLDVNEAFERVSGYRRDEVIGRTVNDLRFWVDPPERRLEVLKQLESDGFIRNLEHRFCRKNGEIGTGLLSIELIYIDGKRCAVATNVDISDRKLAEEERKRLEDRSRQAQKLESVGRLAAGVAHDFNNLLTVINGYSAMLTDRLHQEDPLWSYADEIRKMGDRAASLTRQLLSFSRTQIIQPKALDLNAIITESERMLRRLIGEDIGLFTKLDPLLGFVLADPEQVHQVIMNLVVNARDAMPDGGNLFVKTMNVQVGDDPATVHPDARPGAYVMMTVTDTGSGIDEDTRQHIFEPFFTTKDRDKGTGLGLSTVYGIVRQSGGWIEVSSEPSVGTSFKLHFPRIEASPVEALREFTRPSEVQGDETVLIVEDQEAVLRYSKAILEAYGYQVLHASNGDEAVAVARNFSGEIHLLLTDVVLPGMNGKVLTGHLQAMRPNLKALFMSGYPSGVIAHRGVLDSGVAYIPKPFSPDGLASKIREVLSVPPANLHDNNHPLRSEPRPLGSG